MTITFLVLNFNVKNGSYSNGVQNTVYNATDKLCARFIL